MEVARAILKESSSKTNIGISHKTNSSDSAEDAELLLEAAETLCVLVARQVRGDITSQTQSDSSYCLGAAWRSSPWGWTAA